MNEDFLVEKMVHGGQALATAQDGRKVFLWNALPGEIVNARIIKKRRDYFEAIADNIKKASKDRIVPIEPAYYLATSPWQMMTYDAEKAFKKQIIAETFKREHVDLPHFSLVSGADKEALGYRNKMEYSFFGDNDGLHLALHNRGSHQKIIVSGSALAMPAIDEAASNIARHLGELGVMARQLKSVMVRCDQQGQVVAALFCKDKEMPTLARLGTFVKGLSVYYSDPRSPASVTTSLMEQIGDPFLTDELNGHSLSYSATSFFQVNIPVFQQTLKRISTFIPKESEVIDMYSGVGSIGLSISKKPILVELDHTNIELAKRNAGPGVKIIEASTEKALEYIVPDKILIVDPPRSGLHPKLTAKITETRPRACIYLSCNPVTQARDLAQLKKHYDLEFFEAYNFFPRTPHIETLAILKAR